MRGYPRRFAALLLGTLATAFVTGLLLAPTTLALRAEWDMPWRLGGGGRTAAAALHAAAAFALMAFAGALWAVHMRRGWHLPRQRRSGVMLASAVGLLAATALLLYYAGDERLALGAALVHLGVGLGGALPMAWHLWWRRRRRRHALQQPAMTFRRTRPAAATSSRPISPQP